MLVSSKLTCMLVEYFLTMHYVYHQKTKKSNKPLILFYFVPKTL